MEKSKTYRIEWPLKIFRQSYSQGLTHPKGSTGSVCQSMVDDQALGFVLKSTLFRALGVVNVDERGCDELRL